MTDLSQLARPAPDARRGTYPANARRRRTLLFRYVIPVLLLAGFAATLAYSSREWLFPGKPVTVTPVMAIRATGNSSGAMLFQSAGWVEPRPTPVIVSALEEGIVQELLVIEGQQLKQGDPVARLIDADARLALRNAEAEVASRKAELSSAQAALTAADIRLREPIELQTKLAEAEAMLAQVDTVLARLPSQSKAAEARSQLAKQELSSRTTAGDAVSRLALARAENEHQAATAALAELESQRSTLANERAAQQRRVDALRRQLELKIEEHLKYEEAQAAMALAHARLSQASVALDSAKLRLERMAINAPCDGKVLALVARPGTKLMGLTPASMPDASTVVTMYDPTRLQVRADVRLEDVPHVVPGQQVSIETLAIQGALIGEVIAATSFADIQKNTLQVKIAIREPPPHLKPDMLVRVTFRPPEQPQNDSASTTTTWAIGIPLQLVVVQGEQPHVWVADRDKNVAQLRAVTVGGMISPELREIKSGLAIGDRLIASGAESLRHGDRIRVVAEAK